MTSSDDETTDRENSQPVDDQSIDKEDVSVASIYEILFLTLTYKEAVVCKLFHCMNCH